MTAPVLLPAPPTAVLPPRPAPRSPRPPRLFRLAALAPGLLLAAARMPLSTARTRRSTVVRAAAGVLTALGVRVEVRASPVAWPRCGAAHGPGNLVVTGRLDWLGSLAVLTVVPAVPVTCPEVAGWPMVGTLARRSGAVVPDRRPGSGPDTARRAAALLRSGTSVTGSGTDLLQAAVDAGAAVCPVAVRVRGLDGEATTRLGRLLAVAGSVGLVVEVRLLAPVPAGDDVDVLAARVRASRAGATRVGPVALSRSAGPS